MQYCYGNNDEVKMSVRWSVNMCRPQRSQFGSGSYRLTRDLLLPRGDLMQIDSEGNAALDTEPEKADPPMTPRARYLRYQLGLSHDPFLHFVAEQEIDHQPKHFYIYYTDPDTDLPALLAQAKHSVVFAPPGSGKTTLRLNLARRLRSLEPAVLPVTFELTSLELSSPGRADEQLILETSKDLLISLFHQYRAKHPPVIEAGSPAAQLLAYLLTQRNYHHMLERLLHMPDDRPLSSLWTSMGRPGTPHLAWTSPALRSFAAQLLALPYDDRHPITVLQLPGALRPFGFTHLYLLVDGVDATGRSLSDMVEMLQPAFAWAYRDTPWLRLKLFLPTELEPFLKASVDRLMAQNTQQLIYLHWTDEHLEQALLQRLRTAHSAIQSVSELFDPHDAAAISKEITVAANGSPRELFRLLSATIDAHVARSTQSLPLAYVDWKAGSRSTSYS